MAKKPADITPRQTDIDPAAAEPEVDPEIAAAEEEDAIPPKETAREQVLSTIQSAREEQLRENGIELEPEEEDDPDKEGDDDEEADAGTPAGEEEDQPAAEGKEGDGEPAADAETVTVVVDGQERTVPLKDLVATYQKNAAADLRLQQANQILDAAEEARARILRGEDTAPAPDKKPAPAPDQDSNPLDAINWQEAVDKLQFGSKEEGAAALRELVEQVTATNKQTGVSIDIEATQREIEQRVTDRQEWNSALADFGENYQDIIADPQLQAMTANRANQMFRQAIEESVAAGRPARPAYASIFKAAGDETRAWLKTVRGEGGGDSDDPQPKPSAQPSVDLSKERTDTKRTTSNIPKPRSVQKSTGTAEAKTKTPDQIRREGIDQIVKSREKVA